MRWKSMPCVFFPKLLKKHKIELRDTEKSKWGSVRKLASKEEREKFKKQMEKVMKKANDNRLKKKKEKLRKAGNTFGL